MTSMRAFPVAFVALTLVACPEIAETPDTAAFQADCLQVPALPNAVESGHHSVGLPYLTASGSPLTWAVGRRVYDATGRRASTLEAATLVHTLDSGATHLTAITSSSAWDGALGLYEIAPGNTLDRSDDGGATWTTGLALPFDVGPASNQLQVTNIHAHGDRVVVWTSVQGAFQAALSRDRGANFTMLTMPEEPPQARKDVLKAVVGDGGKLALLIKLDIERVHHLSVSNDDGVTWTRVRDFELSSGTDLAIASDGAL